MQIGNMPDCNVWYPEIKSHHRRVTYSKWVRIKRASSSGLQRLHSTNDDAVNWLEWMAMKNRTNSWHRVSSWITVKKWCRLSSSELRHVAVVVSFAAWLVENLFIFDDVCSYAWPLCRWTRKRPLLESTWRYFTALSDSSLPTVASVDHSATRYSLILSSNSASIGSYVVFATCCYDGRNNCFVCRSDDLCLLTCEVGWTKTFSPAR